MSMKKIDHYEPEVCDSCGQTKTYLLPLDQGSVDILRAISVAIYRKGINAIHPRKEMEMSKKDMPSYLMTQEGKLTSNQVGNLSRPRFHGLIAKVKGEGNKGNYCLTRKASEFMRGVDIPRFAIVSKAEKRNAGYFEPEKYMINIRDFKGDSQYWEGINFNIVEGRIIKDLPTRKTQPSLI